MIRVSESVSERAYIFVLHDNMANMMVGML